MRLRRLELAVIALTLAFICFMGGYFTGRKGAVNMVTIEPRQNESKETAGAIEAPAADMTGSAQTQTPQTGGAEDTATSTGTSGASGSEAVPGDTTAAQTPEIVGAPRGGDGKININLASQSELTDLPGIGSVLASRIVDYRRQHGDFNRIEDLRNVSGIGEKRFEAIQDKITVG